MEPGGEAGAKCSCVCVRDELAHVDEHGGADNVDERREKNRPAEAQQACLALSKELRHTAARLRPPNRGLKPHGHLVFDGVLLVGCPRLHVRRIRRSIDHEFGRRRWLDGEGGSVKLARRSGVRWRR